MRTLLIVVGVVVVLWLGFLTLQHNTTQTHLNRHDQQFQEVDNNFNSLDERYQTKDGFISEDNPIDKTEDKLDQTEDKADQKIEMPYEEDKTNENTNLKEDDNELPKPNNEDEIDLKPNPNLDGNDENELDQEKGKDKLKPRNNRASLPLEDDSIVAFGYVHDHLYRGHESIEAFQLDHQTEDVITAFRVR